MKREELPHPLSCTCHDCYIASLQAKRPDPLDLTTFEGAAKVFASMGHEPARRLVTRMALPPASGKEN